MSIALQHRFSNGLHLDQEISDKKCEKLCNRQQVGFHLPSKNTTPRPDIGEEIIDKEERSFYTKAPSFTTFTDKVLSRSLPSFSRTISTENKSDQLLRTIRDDSIVFPSLTLPSRDMAAEKNIAVTKKRPSNKALFLSSSRCQALVNSNGNRVDKKLSRSELVTYHNSTMKKYRKQKKNYFSDLSLVAARHQKDLSMEEQIVHTRKVSNLSRTFAQESPAERARHAISMANKALASLNK